MKMIGVYRTLDAAKAAVDRLSTRPGFAESPVVVDPDTNQVDGFYIGEYELDEDHWTEGFITLVGDRHC
ncbi:hypothetical protein [Rhodanobacter sp. DHG33]|uniref:DUF7336 domain-containing protein n=1 Tax=Rhodanobacter sp. DHG33 TaxID=2775921 RepID=UPI001CE23044|nr:hypothetical protein [Rhodanobacter sp. DHG33]